MEQGQQDWQFWWNWWVNFGVAVGTFAAALVALFGEALRSKFFPPNLSLRLLSTDGEKGRIRYNGGGLEKFEDARLYHLRVSNVRRRLSSAQDVQVFLTRVEEPGPDGTLQLTWSSDLPMTWRHQQISPLIRTIGHDYDCDLLSTGKDGWLSLSTAIVPLTLNARRTSACTMVVSFQAKSTETDSPLCRIQIAWDGKWEDGDIEMRRHLVVKQLRTEEDLVRELPIP